MNTILTTQCGLVLIWLTICHNFAANQQPTEARLIGILPDVEFVCCIKLVRTLESQRGNAYNLIEIVAVNGYLNLPGNPPCYSNQLNGSRTAV